MVIAGARARQDRQGPARAAPDEDRVLVERLQPGEAAHEAARRAAAGRHRREGGADPRLERHAALRRVQQADPRRPQAALEDGAHASRVVPPLRRAAATQRMSRWPARLARALPARRSCPALMKELGLRERASQVPRLEKIVLNMGLGEAIAERRSCIESAVEELAAITGQKPVVTQGARSRSRTSSCARACRSACMVTLRGDAHVRVPRPPDERRAAARARLQGRVAERRSTAAATTRSASASRSSSRRSTTTRSRR